MKQYLRRCRKHQLNLEEVGDVLLCPAGQHVCEDFQVIDRATGAIAKAVPEEEGAAAEEKAERKEQAMPVKKIEKPHGTKGRYWQGCRCQPCRDAITAHMRAKREKKPATAAEKPTARPAKPTREKRGRGRTLASIVGEIRVLRSQLAKAEAELAREVREVLPNHLITETLAS